MQHRLRCLNGAHVACLSIQFVVGVQQDVTDLKTYLEEKARRLGRRCYQLQPHVVVLAEAAVWPTRVSTVQPHVVVLAEAAVWPTRVSTAQYSTRQQVSWRLLTQHSPHGVKMLSERSGRKMFCESFVDRKWAKTMERRKRDIQTLE